jgi:Protein of unknown function (DUF1553)/Protein of unknown function (DUF1549)
LQQGDIDALVEAHWKQLGIQPADICPDTVFARRVYLDATGTLPSAAEAAEFLASAEPAKRAVLIDRLLEREEFGDYLAMKWSDLLRVKAEFPINLWPNAAQAYYHWIRESIREGMPYDRFARELLTASGSNFRSAPANFYRALQSRSPQGIAQAVALAFLGTRDPRMTPMPGFFSQVAYKETGEWKEEIVYFDPDRPRPASLSFPDGTPARVAPGQDPREVLAQWLTSPKNPWFARAIVNRVWYWLLGRGIIHEPDDIRPDNPPENPELLAYLAGELTAAAFDLKHVFRIILNSTAYQRDSVPQAGAAHFASYPLRRLEAEVLIDALDQVTGTGEIYSSSIPEPYTFMPDDQRAISLPDGSITSPFLELFGRPPRDTGYESERNNRITDAQRLHLLNSTHIQRKIQQSPKLIAMMREIRDPKELVNRIYLTILSRYPTADELKVVAGYGRGRPAVVDLAWALINNTEFLYRH